jgi:hypothetical protein
MARSVVGGPLGSELDLPAVGDPGIELGRRRDLGSILW